MSIEKVREYFKGYGIEDKILEFPVSSATVELAAKALNTEGCRIAKTLSFSVNESPILIVTAGDAKIDNKKYKTYFGAKAKMLNFDDVEEKIGHAVGGVCPFAINDGIKVYLDESIKRFETVFPRLHGDGLAIQSKVNGNVLHIPAPPYSPSSAMASSNRCS